MKIKENKEKLDFDKVVKKLAESGEASVKLLRFYQFFKNNKDNEMTGRDWNDRMREFSGQFIIDIDGWRLNDGCDYDETKIDVNEFHERFMMCTVGG